MGLMWPPVHQLNNTALGYIWDISFEGQIDIYSSYFDLILAKYLIICNQSSAGALQPNPQLDAMDHMFWTFARETNIWVDLTEFFLLKITVFNVK